MWIEDCNQKRIPFRKAAIQTDSDFHFGVLHPVVRALSRLSGKPSFTTSVQGVYCTLHVSAFTGHHHAEHTI
jgi:hypothetical protein